MKFHKSDIFKMGGTALLTVALTITVLKLNFMPAYGFIVSDRISLDDARTYAAEYRGYSRHLDVAVTDASGTRHRQTLEGLRFDARQIDEIINHNRNPGPANDSTADELMIYFGKNGSTSTGVFSSVANIHIIAVGVKGGSLMLDRTHTSDVNASSLFDKTQPCPGSPGCPTTLQ